MLLRGAHGAGTSCEETLIMISSGPLLGCSGGEGVPALFKMHLTMSTICRSAPSMQREGAPA